MKKMIIASAFAALALPVFAAPAADAPPADCNGIAVATGPAGKGYSLLFRDMQKVCGGVVKMCEVRTDGSLDNLNVLATKEADIGFVQVEDWSTMKNGNNGIAALQYLFPTNYNFLHVLVNANGQYLPDTSTMGKLLMSKGTTVYVNKFTDLRGKTVVLVGSAKLLGRQLNKQLDYKMQFIDVATDKEALDIIRPKPGVAARAAAVFTLSGWPSGVVNSLSPSDNITMVPFDAPIGEPYKVKPLNYKSIAVYNSNTLGVPNALVTRPFTGPRAQQVAALRSCILNNLTELKEGKYQPAWNEVNPSGTVGNMTKFK